MPKFVLIAWVLFSSAAFAQNHHPHVQKETCGLLATKKYFKFSHQGTLIDDRAALTFTRDGGFRLYDEEGSNHAWILDADGLVLTKRILTQGLRSYTNYSLDAVPRARSDKGTLDARNSDWTVGFEFALHDIVNMETTVATEDDTDEQVRTALNCAHLILINAVARGQERLLEEKTNTNW